MENGSGTPAPVAGWTACWRRLRLVWPVLRGDAVISGVRIEDAQITVNRRRLYVAADIADSTFLTSGPATLQGDPNGYSRMTGDITNPWHQRDGGAEWMASQ